MQDPSQPPIDEDVDGNISRFGTTQNSDGKTSKRVPTRQNTSIDTDSDYVLCFALRVACAGLTSNVAVSVE